MPAIASPEPSRISRSRCHASRRGRIDRGVLGRYVDPAGRSREVVALPGYAGSVLVIDRDAGTLSDRRLVAHLSADEPSGNAALICRHYLQDRGGRWCRAVTPADLRAPSPASPPAHEPLLTGCPESCPDSSPSGASPADGPTDRHGYGYRLGPVRKRLSIPDLRWLRLTSGGTQTVSLREVVASLESYEPVRSETSRALVRHRESSAVSVAVLRAELQRLDASRIVLNRGLRNAVLDAVQRQGLSMSEIAIRCGRVKHDSRGNPSGETSWLARRVGISPEGGEQEPTPWVHSEVLALIAREGLGISPREVELG
jgi:hypothetical protein